jgi:tripartite-type tricarboxylate transporter receptor subunit TctC
MTISTLSALKTRANLFFGFGALFAVGLTSFVQAQTVYPVRPVTLIVPYPAGGANDAVGRLVGQKLSETLGQPVIIENRPGAGTTIGSALAAKATPDGYTVVLGSLASHAVSPHLFANAGYDALKDFDAIGMIGVAPIIATVSQDAKYTSLKALVDDAKQRPGELTYGSAGNGSPLHLAGALFAQDAGIDIVHVPYKGGNAHTMDLIGGRISVIFDTSTAAMPMIKGGKTRALAVSADSRMVDLPNVPTFKEAGYPSFDVSAWYALYVPAKTPGPVIARLSKDLGLVMKMPEVDTKLRELGVTPSFGSPAALTEFTQAEFAKHGKVIKANNIKTD